MRTVTNTTTSSRALSSGDSLSRALERAREYLRESKTQPTTAGRPNYERDGSHVIVGKKVKSS
jgi:hypothetical protein